MKTVISASRRTDIPAFYLNWLIKGIRRGSLEISNPIYRKQSIIVDLSPDRVEWIVFWSRNYSQLLKNLPIFQPYKLFFHFTLVSHDPNLEKTTLRHDQALVQAETLVKHFGADHLIWRYDPIVNWRDQTSEKTNFNESEFGKLCRRFGELGVQRCYFSFVTLYKKFLYRFTKKYPDYHITEIKEDMRQEVLNRIKHLADCHNIQLYSCCNNSLVDEKIQRGHCVDGSLLNQLSGENLVSRAKNPTRNDCGCTRSIDIGDYVKQPCYFGCIYCYANPVWE
jgi:hypothetical protein